MRTMTRNKAKGFAVLLSAAMMLSTTAIPAVDAKTKKPKLSTTKISVEQGKKVKVTVKNAKKVTWKLNKAGKKIISLSKKSKKGVTIKAKKAGKAKVSVKMKTKKKTYKKKLTVIVTRKQTTNTTNTNANTDKATPTPSTTPTPTATPTPTPTQTPDAAPQRIKWILKKMQNLKTATVLNRVWQQQAQRLPLDNSTVFLYIAKYRTDAEKQLQICLYHLYF